MDRTDTNLVDEKGVARVRVDDVDALVRQLLNRNALGEAFLQQSRHLI